MGARYELPDMKQNAGFTATDAQPIINMQYRYISQTHLLITIEFYLLTWYIPVTESTAADLDLEADEQLESNRLRSGPDEVLTKKMPDFKPL
jgi:hypothetical protein